MKINIRLRLEMLRPGVRYGWKGDGDDAVQTEAQYRSLIVWLDPDTTKPAWADIQALGDVETTEQQKGERTQMVVSRFQARAALHNAGLLTAVNTIMQDPATDPIVVLAWEEIPTFHRLSPAVQAIGAAIGLDDEALDDLFRAAALITV